MATLPNQLPHLTLPAGTLVDTTGDGPWHEPLLWYAAEPARPGDWSRLRATGRPLGLLPVLIDGGRRDEGPTEWELRPADTTYPGDHDAEEVLSEAWEAYASDELEVPAPWPGLAPAPAASTAGTPDELAAGIADMLADTARPALVPARRSADIPAAIGWTGPLNHENDVARLCAVLRSWEDRFDIRVVELGFDTLKVSVGRPPTTEAEAYALAAEHFAFCPDNIGATPPGGLCGYAHSHLLGQEVWTFWWD
ncbi:DUF4253 domain-containing protein [Streptomyces atroolivaceus]|uniref:DUF4253 domain-containing protein n=1 Tax=Streptomyces atroolivaceus TaxID=66869 RepID=UPI00202407FF|nr:DUF4253 domain-containing protein [Streptomyces atroolivaceus]